MADGKLDLPEDLPPVKPVESSWTVKVPDGVAGRHGEDKGLLGYMEDPKDQGALDNSIPLSPQWLYAKPGESKAVVSSTSGDARIPSFFLQGSSVDPMQKDRWRQEGSQDKKDWRRTVPDMESSHRWREEERETGLLGRRERRKEGDRDGEYRKGDRRVDSSALRESTDSRTLPSSERWHDGGGRNSGHEGRRDSKWSSRWGPEDKDESRTEKKVETDKDESHSEKSSFIASARIPSESDSRDKWRPRHRQEVHSVGPTVYHAAPGFGLERGRGDGGVAVGFAPGRGRANITGTSATVKLSNNGPIGSAPLNKNDPCGKSGLYAYSFRYPRGKLLDIYRGHEIYCDIVPDTVEDIPQITSSVFIKPLAFVTPHAEEEQAILDDIWEGKITSSDSSSSANGDRSGRVSDSGKEKKDILVFKDDTEGNGHLFSKSSTCNPFSQNQSPIGDEENKTGSSSGIVHSSGLNTSTCLMDTVVPPKHASILLGSFDRSFSEVKALNGEGNDFCDLLNFQEIDPVSSSEEHAKLVTKSRLFDAPVLMDVGNEAEAAEQYQQSSSPAMLERQRFPEELTLLYRDPQGEIQGPFLGADIIMWFDQGFFGTDLPVCLSDSPIGTPFQQLGELMPHLRLRSISEPAGECTDKHETFNAHTGNLNSGVHPPESTVSVSMNYLGWAESGNLVQPDQQKISQHGDLVNYFQTSSNENLSSNLNSKEQNFHDLGGVEAEEVLYSGRPLTIKSGRVGINDNLSDIPQIPSGHSLSSETRQHSLPNQSISSYNDVHPLGLLWSELEGARSKRPLSSNISGISDQGHFVHPGIVRDLSAIKLQNEGLTALAEHSSNQDTWSNTQRSALANPNIHHDILDACQLSHLEQEPNQFDLQEHLLVQQLQRQHLQKKNILHPHQNMHLNTPFLEQMQIPHHHQAINPLVSDREEQLLKFQIQQQRQIQIQQQQIKQKQQQQQLHHLQMRLLHQQQSQQQQQQLQAERMMLQQLQQVHDHDFGLPHVDAFSRNNMPDQALLRQRLVHEAQQKSQHSLRHVDPTLAQLFQAKFGQNFQPEHTNDLLDVLAHSKHRQLHPFEQRFAGLQHELLQGRQIAGGSRQFSGIDEERQASAWSVDESNQFARAASGLQSHSTGTGQLDFLQQRQQRQQHLDLQNHTERTLGVFEQLQRGLYNSNSQSFERSPAGGHGLNIDFVNSSSSHQGLDIQQQLHMNQSGRLGQFPTGLDSSPHHYHHQIPSHFSGSQLDASEKCWRESNSQLPNIVDSQRTHLVAERQKQELRINPITDDDMSSWITADGSEDSQKRALIDILNQKHEVYPSQSLETGISALTSSQELKESTWPFPLSCSDHQQNCLADRSAASDHFTKSYNSSEIRKVLPEQSAKTGLDGLRKNIEDTERLDLRNNTLGFGEVDQFFPSTGESGQVYAGSNVDSSMELMKFVEQKGKKLVSKGRVNNKMNVEVSEGQISGYSMDPLDLTINPPIRHSSFGSSGSNAELYITDMGLGNAYCDEMRNDRTHIIPNLSGNRPKRNTSSHIIPSQEAIAELSAPVLKGRTLSNTSVGDVRQGQGGTTLVPEIPNSRKNARFSGVSTFSDTEAAEATFVDMLKKPVPEPDIDTAPAEAADGVQGGKSGKKRGKKGKQIDPSLLGFKVHSNRIMMGEIQRLDD